MPVFLSFVNDIRPRSTIYLHICIKKNCNVSQSCKVNFDAVLVIYTYIYVYKPSKPGKALLYTLYLPILEWQKGISDGQIEPIQTGIEHYGSLMRHNVEYLFQQLHESNDFLNLLCTVRYCNSNILCRQS